MDVGNYIGSMNSFSVIPKLCCRLYCILLP